MEINKSIEDLFKNFAPVSNRVKNIWVQNAQRYDFSEDLVVSFFDCLGEQMIQWLDQGDTSDFQKIFAAMDRVLTNGDADFREKCVTCFIDSIGGKNSDSKWYGQSFREYWSPTFVKWVVIYDRWCHGEDVDFNQ